MGYCIDDLCHGGTPICGATSPYHCTATSFGEHPCSAPECEVCQPDDESYAEAAYEAKSRPPDWLLDDVKRGAEQLRQHRADLPAPEEKP